MAKPETIAVTVRNKRYECITTVQAKPVTVAGMTMGLHKAVRVGKREGISYAPFWTVTEPVTGCTIGGEQRDATAAINAARKAVRDKGGPEAVAKRIEQLIAHYAKFAKAPARAAA